MIDIWKICNFLMCNKTIIDVVTTVALKPGFFFKLMGMVLFFLGFNGLFWVIGIFRKCFVKFDSVLGIKNSDNMVNL